MDVQEATKLNELPISTFGQMYVALDFQEYQLGHWTDMIGIVFFVGRLRNSYLLNFCIKLFLCNSKSYSDDNEI